MSLQDLYLRYETVLRPLLRIGPVFGGAALLAWRVRETRVPVTRPGFDRTDLVFIDPVGTGCSRVTRPEFSADFYQTRGDAESVAEFIRVFEARFGRWAAPVYLAGESFGVTRAAGVAEVLGRRRIPVRGVVLIGLTLPLEPIPPTRGRLCD